MTDDRPLGEAGSKEGTLPPIHRDTPVPFATCIVRYTYDGLMTPQEAAEAALRAWATVQRDELVQAAHRTGVSKNRIHVITGIARTTIDRILETPMGIEQQALTDYLAKFTAQWPRHQPWAWNPYAAAPFVRSADQVAAELLADAEFRALKLGTWLSTPDGEFLAAAATALTPPIYKPDVEVLIKALQLAAKQQQSEARKTLAAGTAVAAVLALAVATSGK